MQEDILVPPLALVQIKYPFTRREARTTPVLVADVGCEHGKECLADLGLRTGWLWQENGCQRVVAGPAGAPIHRTWE